MCWRAIKRSCALARGRGPCLVDLNIPLCSKLHLYLFEPTRDQNPLHTNHLNRALRLHSSDIIST